jgi:prepilin-type N-terminal cleavage/methylation domain-containing protein
MKKGGKNKCRKGFTLIELLVSMVVFVMIMGIVGSSFTSIVRAQKEANEVRRMYSEVRSFTDLLAEEARLGVVDYQCYTAAADPYSGVCPQALGSIVNGRSNFLALVTKDGLQKTIFKYDATAKKVSMIKYEKTDSGGWGIAPGYTDFRDVMGTAVSVEKLAFAINPDADPYAQANYGINSRQFQPKVTLFMNAKNGQNSKSPFSLDFQTTISSRVYNR